MKDALDKDELKKAYFTYTTFDNKKKYKKVKELKSMGSILGSIADEPKFSEVRKRYKIHNFLGKILTQNLLDFILFAYYKNQKLTIAVWHPVGQQELNFKKPTIMQYARYMDSLKDLKEIAVFRIDKLNRLSKDFDQAFYDRIHKKEEQEEKLEFFEEKSFGIFSNKCKNDKLNKEFENIREVIKKTKNR